MLDELYPFNEYLKEDPEGKYVTGLELDGNDEDE